MHNGHLLISWAVSVLLNQTPKQWRSLEQSRRFVKLFSKSCRVIENSMLKCVWPNLPNKMHAPKAEWMVCVEDPTINKWSPYNQDKIHGLLLPPRLVLQSNSMFIYAIEPMKLKWAFGLKNKITFLGSFESIGITISFKSTITIPNR